METISKHIEDNDEFLRLSQVISQFPRIHNKIKNDFVTLLETTELNKEDTDKFITLCRACIKGFFSLIEADIYYYNLFDSYEGYKDRQPFLERFKKTFKQICTTWKREELHSQYFDLNLNDIKSLKVMRDRLIHPKELIDIIDPTDKTFEFVKLSFKNYDEFVNSLMSNFFISTKLPFDITGRRLT